jgi:hypothetical protein
MKKHFKNIFLFIFFLLLGKLEVSAQLYPVQLTPVFNSPYSTKISDYATSIDPKMQLLINPTDISINNRQVRLKLFIQGNGINAQSSSFIQGQNPIFISGGELQTLTNVDISALFRLENLEGISAVQYANPLPDGMYSFCFEMYDFSTNQKLSQKSCAMMYLQLNDPPLLNIPAKNEQIIATDFPNILFTWTPRQINATNVSYTFELKEILDPNLDPQYGFLIAPMLYQETDMHSTALVYDLGKPSLIPGKKYAWRVRAVSTSGLSENSVFKNDGYSEIFYFKYASNCSAPTFLLSQAQSPKSAKITWQTRAENFKYHLQYRTKGVNNAQWFSVYTQNNQTTLTDLGPGKSYEFRVGATCDVEQHLVEQGYVYSNIQEFTMPTQKSEDTSYNCGITPKISIQNQKPIDNLIESETFTAGDFPVTILELSGHNPYSGKGYIIVPYLADTKIAVEFKDITINTNYQLINGIVETSYDPSWKNVADVDEQIDNVKELFNDLTGLVNSMYDLLKKKEEGSLTDEEFREQRFEYITKVQDQLDKLKNESDLPEDLKKKIDDLKPVILDLASNDWSASGNNSKDNIDKIAEVVKEYDSYNKEKQALIEKISAGIDFQKLITWMRDNSGKTIVFDYKQFLSKDFELTGSGLGIPQTLHIDRDFEFNSDGEKRKLSFKGTLSTRKEIITLSAKNSPIGLNIDLDKSSITYDFNYSYDKIVENEDNIAINLKTNQITNYDALLGLLNFSIGETSSKAKQYVVDKFDKAFQIAGSDCNKIDFLYADAPNFIIAARGNDKLWTDLQSLSKCSIHYLGTNENNSILNILANIDNKWIFSKQVNNINFFADLYTKLNLDYRPQYIRVLSEIGLKNWTSDQINNSQPFFVIPIKIDGFTTQEYDEIASWCIENNTKTKYKVGYNYHSFKTGDLQATNTITTDLGEVEKIGPVHIRINENDYLMPAFIAYMMTDEAISNDRNTILNNSFSVLLPEFERLSLNKLKWLGNVGNKIDEIFDVTKLKEITEVIPTGSKLTNLSYSKFTKGFDAGLIESLGSQYVDDLVKIKQGLDKGGELTESIVSEALRKQGYTVTKDIGKYGSNNGLDVVAYKGILDSPTEIMIIEAKQFKQGKILEEFDDIVKQVGYDSASGLTINPANPETGLPTQMSRKWVFEHVADKLNKKGGDFKKLSIALEKEDIVNRYVFAIDKSDGAGYFVKLSKNF